jgi:carboxymethylenebutenolidase
MGQQTAVAERELVLRAADGAQIPVFIAEPAGAPGAPRVVIAPEIFGVSQWIKSVARRLAHEGFRAVAPEIFARDREPVGSDMQAWMARIRRLDIPQAVRELRSSLELLQGGPAASIGFCLGGALSLLAASEGGLSACVACYGRPRWMVETPAPHAIDAARRISCPVLGIYGKRDAGIPLAAVEELRAALPAGSELALYEAGHAFLNDTRAEMYVADQAALAWAKIVGFLRRSLS